MGVVSDYKKSASRDCVGDFQPCCGAGNARVGVVGRGHPPARGAAPCPSAGGARSLAPDRALGSGGAGHGALRTGSPPGAGVCPAPDRARRPRARAPLDVRRVLAGGRHRRSVPTSHGFPTSIGGRAPGCTPLSRPDFLPVRKRAGPYLLTTTKHHPKHDDIFSAVI